MINYFDIKCIVLSSNVQFALKVFIFVEFRYLLNLYRKVNY